MARAFLKFIKRAKLVNGVFFVSKKRAKGKPKRLRMIIDCRTANKFFKPPPRTVLGSVEALTRLRLDVQTPGENLTLESSQKDVLEDFCNLPAVEKAELEQTLFLSQEDVRDFFRRIHVDDIPELCEYFALPPVCPRLLASLYAKAGQSLPAEIREWLEVPGKVFPALTVLAMGFSWSFHLAQCVHEHIADNAVPAAKRFSDRKPPPTLSSRNSVIMLYADNGNHLSLSAKVCNRS